MAGACFGEQLEKRGVADHLNCVHVSCHMAGHSLAVASRESRRADPDKGEILMSPRLFSYWFISSRVLQAGLGNHIITTKDNYFPVINPPEFPTTTKELLRHCANNPAAQLRNQAPSGSVSHQQKLHQQRCRRVNTDKPIVWSNPDAARTPT
jgi:hypothetical protein